VRSVLGRTAAVQMKRREWTNRVDFLSGRWDVGPRIWSATGSCSCRKWRGGGPCWIQFTELSFIQFYFEVEEHLEQLGRCALCAQHTQSIGLGRVCCSWVDSVVSGCNFSGILVLSVPGKKDSEQASSSGLLRIPVLWLHSLCISLLIHGKRGGPVTAS
jgi:hypothetical protein